MTPQELYERYRFDEPTRPTIQQLRHFPFLLTPPSLHLIEMEMQRINLTTTPPNTHNP